LRAKAKGFSSRSQERRVTLDKNIAEVQAKFPLSWQRFVGDQPETKQLAKDFLKAFGKYPRNVSHRYRDESEELREAYIAAMETRGQDWNWNLWRSEYASL